MPLTAAAQPQASVEGEKSNVLGDFQILRAALREKLRSSLKQHSTERFDTGVNRSFQHHSLEAANL